MKAVSSRSNISGLVIAIAVALLGVTAIVAPATLMRWAPSCIIFPLLGDVCWGCGMTRATVALLHFNLGAAWGLNKLSFVVVPMLLVFYAKHLLTTWRNLARRLPGA